jgi:hypothetical protein
MVGLSHPGPFLSTQVDETRLPPLCNVKILSSARPDEIICLKARLAGRLANLIQAQTTASVNGLNVLQAELVLSGDENKSLTNDAKSRE